MKRLLLPFVLLVSISATAQFSFGIKAGVNLSNLHFKITDNSNVSSPKTNSALGFHLGMYTNLKLSNKFSFCPEIQYSMQGYKGRMNYLTLPVLFSYSLLKNLKIDLGPTPSILVYNKLSKLDIYKSFDWGVTGGLRFALSEKISILARYYYGLFNIEKTGLQLIDSSGTAVVYVHEKAYNRNLQIGLSYKLK